MILFAGIQPYPMCFALCHRPPGFWILDLGTGLGWLGCPGQAGLLWLGCAGCAWLGWVRMGQLVWAQLGGLAVLSWVGAGWAGLAGLAGLGWAGIVGLGLAGQGWAVLLSPQEFRPTWTLLWALAAIPLGWAIVR